MRDQFIQQAGADLPGTLIALDFDGTLAPIVTDPQDSRPLPGVIETLAELAARGARVAVITGREAETAVRLGGFDAVPGLLVAGLYGAQLWVGGELTSQSEPASIVALRERLPGVLEQAGADPAVWIEDKGLSLVVHGRKAEDAAAALNAVRGAVSELADELGLEVHPGRDVLELRVPGYDKGTTLRHIIRDLRPRQVVFAGDDLGDLPAFEEVRALRELGLDAWAVGVTSPEVPELADSVDVAVGGPSGMLQLLRDLSGWVDAAR